METNKPTAEQFAVVLETIKDFFSDYPYTTHSNLSFDVWCICAIDETFGLSDNHKQVILDYLRRSGNVFDAIHLFIDPKFIEQHKHNHNNPIDHPKLERIRETLYKLTLPFWVQEPSEEKIIKRKNNEQYPDKLALANVDKEHLQAIDIGLSFFMRYGLKESLELLDNLFACYAPFKGLGNARKKEIADFYRTLKELLTAIYIQSSDKRKDHYEEVKGGDCE